MDDADALRHGPVAVAQTDAPPGREHLTFPDHPDRSAAVGEAHARPSLPIRLPAKIHHMAFAARDQDAIAALFEAVLGDDFEGSIRHTIEQRDTLTIKWERHTEFVSLTLLAEAPDLDAGDRLLDEVQRAAPPGVSLLVALRTSVRRRSDPPEDEAELGGIGGVLRNKSAISSAFSPGPDGFIDIDIATDEVGSEQLGRRVQRILEAETYRTMALIGLPLARRIGPKLSELEEELVAVTSSLTESGHSDEAILSSLQRLSAEAEAMRAQTRFRFSASKAYAALVEERLESLHEGKRGERQTLTGFHRTRLAPAVRTIVSTEARQEELSAAVSRALNLLRTRVDVSLNQANQDILRSMNERQHRQLILSEAVESLSVIAISYYLLGILSYPVKSLSELGWLPVSQTVALGILAPFVAFAVFATLRGLRSRWMKEK